MLAACFQMTQREKYLCLEKYDEPFDFNCLSKEQLPAHGSEWYTVCGTPFENPMVSMEWWPIGGGELRSTVSPHN